MTTPEELLAEYVASGEASGEGARSRARMLLADAVVLSQANEEVPAFGAVHEIGAGAGEHRSWATSHRIGAADAVYANACAVHARFQDDTDMSTWSHPGSFVVPAAVAAAIEAGTTYGRLIDALVVGYSSTRWLGAEGAVAEGLKARGFRPSPIFAPLGAAAAASRAFGLDTVRAGHALGAAAIVGRGTLHSVGGGGDDWRLHNASGARDGFCLALAARDGMRSAPGALTAHSGFLRTVTGSEEVPGAWAIGPDSTLVERVWHKALPVLGDNMAAALAARALGPVDGAIGEARIVMNAKYAAFPGTQYRPPYGSATARQASVRFVVAHLLVHGDLRYHDLVTAESDAILDLASRIEVVADVETPFEDALVEVRTAEGVRSARAGELPPTVYWRDRAGQFDRAAHTLGERGVAISSALLDADDRADAGAVLEAALG